MHGFELKARDCLRHSRCHSQRVLPQVKHSGVRSKSGLPQHSWHHTTVTSSLRRRHDAHFMRAYSPHPTAPLSGTFRLDRIEAAERTEQCNQGSPLKSKITQGRPSNNAARPFIVTYSRSPSRFSCAAMLPQQVEPWPRTSALHSSAK